MGSLFDQDRAFWRLINKVADLVILNVVFLLCCLPVITIGPAYTALYYTVMKTVRKERGYVMRNFFHSFKQNFLQGTIIWVLIMIVGTFLAMTIYSNWDGALAGGTTQLVMWLAIILAFFLVSIFIYIFPVLSRFEFKIGHTFAFSYLIAIRYIGYTILLMALLAACVVLGVICIPAVILILPALFAFISSFLVEKVFAVYMPKFEAPKNVADNENNNDEEGSFSEAAESENETEKTHKDQWYYD